MNQIHKWMMHSVGLADEMVKFADKYPKRVDRVWLVYARDAQRRVMKAVMLNSVGKLGDADRVWHEFMVAHAEAEVERYAYRMDEVTFFARCDSLRQVRDGKLKAIVNQRRVA